MRGKGHLLGSQMAELIVNGKIHAISEKSIDENSVQSNTQQRPAAQATSNSVQKPG